ncbi:hypothetical protein [Allokutzneria albata]|uniref:hypothetical protein n=1 Tax=Allokutzneria albata TaxID=211114 RepID=UPI0004C3B611|nr:hypothetical protein [Allokutzneria albata]
MTTMQAWYDIDQDHELVLDDATAVDQLLDRLAAGPEPVVVSLFRNEDLANGALPDIEFWVGVGAVPGRGLIQCSDPDGRWVTHSDAPPPAHRHRVLQLHEQLARLP